MFQFSSPSELLAPFLFSQRRFPYRNSHHKDNTLSSSWPGLPIPWNMIFILKEIHCVLWLSGLVNQSTRMDVFNITSVTMRLWVLHTLRNIKRIIQSQMPMNFAYLSSLLYIPPTSIRVTSYQRQSVSNHRQLCCFIFQDNCDGNIKPPVDSTHIWP